jgi:hypothetical protein
MRHALIDLIPLAGLLEPDELTQFLHEFNESPSPG